MRNLAIALFIIFSINFAQAGSHCRANGHFIDMFAKTYDVSLHETSEDSTNSAAATSKTTCTELVDFGGDGDDFHYTYMPCKNDGYLLAMTRILGSTWAPEYQRDVFYLKSAVPPLIDKNFLKLYPDDKQDIELLIKKGMPAPVSFMENGLECSDPIFY